MPSNEEFQEIGHCGGRVTIDFRVVDGQLQYSSGITHSRPTPASLIGIWASRDGIAVGEFMLGGIGASIGPPPYPGCIQVIMASDSEGEFGHLCPSCKKYWRGEGYPQFCPYCGISGRAHHFLSVAQRDYVAYFASAFQEGLERMLEGGHETGRVEIDLDRVSDAVDSVEKPDFYVSEERQQRRFNCPECNAFHDIIGDCAYCSICFTRNDLVIFEEEIIPKIRDELNAGDRPELRVPDAVAAFDSYATHLIEQIVENVPMIPERKNRLRRAVHDVISLATDLEAWFGINLLDGLSDEDIAFVQKMFHRRHVYEHRGGIVDQQHIDASGETYLRLGQRIREDLGDVHQLLSHLSRMARNLHGGFHAILPPDTSVVRRP